MLIEFDRTLRGLDRAGRRRFGEDWIPKLKERRGKLERAYATLYEQDRDPINYASLSAQTAYVFAYAPARAEYTRQFLQRHRAKLAKPLFGCARIKVVSFGGGPASELVGLVRYLEDEDAEEQVEKIEYTVFDKDGDWADVAFGVVESLATDIEIQICYENVDASSRARMAEIDLSQVDLVVFSYLMSELARVGRKDQIAENFRSVLANLRLNSKVLFIDNLHPIFIDYFRSCKAVSGLIEVNDDGEPVICNFSQGSETYQTLSKLLDWVPRTELRSVSKLVVRTRV